jgi:hypothetical protein
VSRTTEPPRIVGVLKDLFWVARIRETARLVGVQAAFVRSIVDLADAVPDAALALVDLTMAGWDYDATFSALQTHRPPLTVIGYTTHAQAGETRALHSRCDRVVTKETLTQELGKILAEPLARAGRTP